MSRPIEKYGWVTKIFANAEEFTRDCIRIAIYNNGNICVNASISYSNSELTFEELQAIYETAKQIRDESDDRTLKGNNL